MMPLIDARLVSSVQPFLYSGGLLLLAGMAFIGSSDD